MRIATRYVPCTAVQAHSYFGPIILLETNLSSPSPMKVEQRWGRQFDKFILLASKLATKGALPYLMPG